MVLRALCECWLVLLFVATATGELANRRQLVTALVSHGWSGRAARLLSWIVPAYGLMLAVLLITRPRSLIVALLVATTLATYVGYRVFLLQRRPGTSCGCGGKRQPVQTTDVLAGLVHLGIACLYGILIV